MGNWCILGLQANIPVMPLWKETDWGEEDSLENTLSCVPKVQGVCRISQAKGQRSKLKFVCHCAVLVRGCFFDFLKVQQQTKRRNSYVR